jgi:NAD(P)-dependent dehydrogenase (short-subunit alcohol dehydrogenase family)
MHVNPIAARRLITGKQIVHGIHVLLTGIEYWQNDSDLLPVSVSCTFNNPISVEDNVLFSQRCRRGQEFVIEATVSELVCARIVIASSPTKDKTRLSLALGENACSADEIMIDRLSDPLDEAADAHGNRVYVIKLGEADFSRQFPRSYRYFGQRRIAAILSLSYFVGMVCPGLHSIFSTVDLNLNLSEEIDGNNCLAFSVEKYDERFHLFNIALRGCIDGSIIAFSRPEPQPQLSLKQLADHVNSEEFKGTKSLIVGGSRGLGEITAKLIAVGGGDVVITYASGVNDARYVGDEINKSGCSSCEILKLDLLTDSFESMNVSIDSLHAVYFFATPRIYRKKASLFDAHLFREFSEFYIEKFYELCGYLEGRVERKKIKVYFPSSVFVSERPDGVTEYAMAKSAAEVMVEDLNKHSRKLTVVTTRLPRLNTDQTSSILRLPTESNVGALLPIIRSMAK